MDSLIMLFLKKWDFHKLIAKLGGVGGSFVASHLVALTATPDYANFWAKIYMTAPHITDVPAFEKMVGFWFATGWLMLEHFYWRIDATSTDHQRATDGPQGETK